MTRKLETTIRIDRWEENPSAEYDDGTKVAHAVAGLTEGNDGLRAGLLESVLYYREDGTSSYAGVIRLEGELDGRTGSFTAVGEGAYDGATAASTMPIRAWPRIRVTMPQTTRITARIQRMNSICRSL